MKLGPSLAAGIAAGYVLGRTRKMRLALTLAAVGATGKLGVRPSDLVQQGLKELASSDIGKAVESARGEVFTLAKDVATKTARSRIDELSGRLTSGLGEAGGLAAGTAGSLTRRRRRDQEPDEEEDERDYDEEEPAARRGEDEDVYREEDQDRDEEPDEDEAEDVGSSRRRPVARRSARRRGDDEADEEEPADEDADEDEAPSRRTRPAARRPARASASSGARTRR